MKTQTSTPTLSSGRARAERCKELEEEKESNATEYGTRDSQEVETEPKKPTVEPTQGKETDGRRQTRQPGQGPGTKTEAGNRPGEQDRASPDLHRHHKPGRRKRGPKEPQSRSRSHARASASATPLLNTRMTASTSQRRHGATARVRPTHGTRHRR